MAPGDRKEGQNPCMGPTIPPFKVATQLLFHPGGRVCQPRFHSSICHSSSTLRTVLASDTADPSHTMPSLLRQEFLTPKTPVFL